MTRVLLVDDSQGVNLLRTLTRGNVWEVRTVAQSSQALEMARQDPPDLAISDLSTLVSDHYSLLRRWKADPELRRIPFVVHVPADADPKEEELALHLGADATLLELDGSDALVARYQAIVDEMDRLRTTTAAASNESEAQYREHCEDLICKLKARVLLLEHAQSALLAKDAQMRMALRAARMGTWEWDVATDRVSWESGHDEQLWSTQPESFQGTLGEFAAGVHPEDREAQQRAIRIALETHGDYEHEYRVVYPDDNVRWVIGCGRPLYDEAGQPVRMLGIFWDITERRLREQQARQTQKMEAIGQLAGGIAHDFNNVLSAIIGNLGVARRDIEAGQPVAQSLREIERASQRAKHLVQQILSFSRKQQTEKHVIALQSVVEESASLLRATMQANVELVTFCADDAPTVLADSSQMLQVLLNLGTNAWHALGGRPGRIEMHLRLVTLAPDAVRSQDNPRRKLDAGRYAQLSVIDDGEGMDPATVSRIFEPFFTTKAEGHGTGLGLSMVADILKTHAGAITVTTALGSGTTFDVYLPALDAPVVTTPPPRRTRTAAQASEGGEHILYLDDEEMLVRLTTRMLEPLGYHVHGFSRVRAALAAFSRDPDQFHLAITDLTMTEADGLEVISQLRALRPDLPVILTSGFVTDELRKRAHEAGVTQVLNKPVNVADFCDAVRTALQSRRRLDGGG